MEIIIREVQNNLFNHLEQVEIDKFSDYDSESTLFSLCSLYEI